MGLAHIALRIRSFSNDDGEGDRDDDGDDRTSKKFIFKVTFLLPLPSSMLKLPAVYAGDSRLTFCKLKAKRERNRPFYSLDQNVLKYVRFQTNQH